MQQPGIFSRLRNPFGGKKVSQAVRAFIFHMESTNILADCHCVSYVTQDCTSGDVSSRSDRHVTIQVKNTQNVALLPEKNFMLFQKNCPGDEYSSTKDIQVGYYPLPGSLTFLYCSCDLKIMF